MITTTAQAVRDLSKCENNFLTAMDEYGNEYIIQCIKKQNRNLDNPYQWQYVLKLQSTESGCLKR